MISSLRNLSFDSPQKNKKIKLNTVEHISTYTPNFETTKVVHKACTNKYHNIDVSYKNVELLYEEI